MLAILLQRAGRPRQISAGSVDSWLDTLFSPDNPFIQWLLIADLILILVHLYLIFWVYRDALGRFNRGAPWAALAAVVPVGGWLFYLIYRNSQLTTFDRIEAETFDEDEPEWTDYDQQQADRGANFFKELGSLWRREEGSGYSPWIRASRDKELKKALTPEEKKALKEKRRAEKAEKRKEAAQEKQKKKEEKALKKQQARERQTVQAAHGFSYKMSDRRQKKLRRQLEVMDQLKKLPREDKVLEDMIYEMQYQKALDTAKSSLGLAEEMQDEQGLITYRAYIERLEGLLEDSNGATA